ncbi:MAG: histidine kinase [Alcanivoracaceae bacterium]|nr:histidine kinase [Alcanivoracaceae bacterium]
MPKKQQLQDIWLTDFCDSLRVFVSIVMIQIAVIIYALSFFSFDFEFLRKLSVLTLLAQLVGLILLILLCKLRYFFNQFDVVKGVVILILLVILLTSFLSQLIGYLDMQLTFHMFANQNAINYLNIKLSVSSALICIALVRYFYIQDQWHKQLQKLSDARLNALQARIRPHFLFNSLNSIASLISIDADRAELAIAEFSSLMRRTFTHKEKFISISEELNWVKRYLAIEKLRLDKRLKYNINCETSLYIKKIPVLCLQPLVENAILHGLQPLENGGIIDIDIFAQANNLFIQVSNPFIVQLDNNSNGMALANIKERLHLQYGSKAFMQIDKDNETYKITISIPL